MPTADEMREAWEALRNWGDAYRAESALVTAYNALPCDPTKPCDCFDECAPHERMRPAIAAAEEASTVAWECAKSLADRLASAREEQAAADAIVARVASAAAEVAPILDRLAPQPPCARCGTWGPSRPGMPGSSAPCDACEEKERSDG